MIVVADLAVDTHYYMPKLINYLKRRSLPFIVVNHVDDMPNIQRIQTIILSGSDLYMSTIHHHPRVAQLLDHIMHKLPTTIPRIGICFGAQFLYTYAGGKLERLHRGICSMRNITADLPTSHVQFCLHEVFTEPIPNGITPFAWARLGNKKRICAFKYENYPWYAFLFHPEANASSWKILDQILPRNSSRSAIPDNPWFA